MRFIEILERLIGQKSQGPRIGAVHDGRVSAGELHGLAKLSRLIFWKEPETYSGGEKLTVIMTTDIDPNTGKVYPDYLERRAARKVAEEEGSGYAGSTGHDVRPD
jgi:hypothetical protein